MGLMMSAQAGILVLVDYQARLMPVIHDGAHVTAQALRLARVAQILGMPVVGTEQNPSRLGPNDAALRALCATTLAKTHFGACPDGLVPALKALKADVSEVVIGGCEAHVCLLQTALGLVEAGLHVRVVADACGSRRPADQAAAMARLAQAGATVVTSEMVMFEWLGDCEQPAFRQVLPLIKQAPVG